VIVALALGLALGIQAWLIKPYQIPSESMEPTLDVGQRVLVNRAKPTPEPSDQNFIKRLVAGPGDTLSIRNGHPVVNGVMNKDEPYALPCGNGGACNLPKTITIPPDHYFMMGDNRGASDDSRYWGPVPRDWLIGKAFATYWPPDRIGIF